LKIGFLSLGCPKNLVDGEVMLGIARQAGHEVTADSSAADVLVVNTCAFIDNAKEESINAILEMAALKREGKCSRLVDELRQEIPEIDALLGTGDVPQILDAIGHRRSPAAAKSASRSSSPAPDLAAASSPLPFYTKSPRLPADAATADMRTRRGC
jgi:ribosomal protein S12 methylthiotransferase